VHHGISFTYSAALRECKTRDFGGTKKIEREREREREREKVVLATDALRAIRAS
jgi:hypothetical protein